MARWLLPENFSDVLPIEARRLEMARRQLLDGYATYGYELVVPPTLEHLDSLLTGSGHDLDLSTFKLVDQLSGRTLGLRADITTQVARIDAHILNRSGAVRLCYAGAVVHARPQHPLANREPFQVGAELYGDGSVAADCEILELAVASLRMLGVSPLVLDLGHTGVLRTLLADLPRPLHDELIVALHGKDYPGLDHVLQGVQSERAAPLRTLARLHGGRETIDRARECLPDVPEIALALDELTTLAASVREDDICIDLADLHGYRYHTGISFAIFAPRLSTPAIRGGRYDDIGAVFGRARPATGFSVLDLRELLRTLPVDDAQPAILARQIPAPGDPSRDTFDALVIALRKAGEVVVKAGAQPVAGNWRFDRDIRFDNGTWWVSALAD